MNENYRNVIFSSKVELCNVISIEEICDSLKESQIFTAAMLQDICDSESTEMLLNELPSRGPNAFDNFLSVLKKSGCDKARNILDKHLKGPKRAIYKMDTEFIGRCLVINNKVFERDSERHGTDVDFKNVCSLFEKLKFHVQPEENLKLVDLKKCLKDFANSPKMADVDSCAVVILSHGDNFKSLDVILGTDGFHITILEVLSIFSTAPSLINKPKFFVFQMCRGKVQDYINFHSPDASACQIYPDKRDMLIVHATLPNHIAYRHEEKGSILIQCLVPVFSKHYLEFDAEKMLKSVDKDMKEMCQALELKQVMHVSTELKALLFFSLEIFSKEEIKERLYSPR